MEGKEKRTLWVLSGLQNGAAMALYQSTKKPPELPSSAKERIKNVVETLAVELKVDVHILLSTVQEVFGRGLGN